MRYYTSDYHNYESFILCVISGTFAILNIRRMFYMRNITGTRIKLARKSAGLTQEALAIRLQILGLKHTRNTIAKIENGFREVNDIELKAIAEALDFSVGWFFEEKDGSANH
jgi:DNA-binding XRE family transcriptional regulator